ncbi:MAG TPA: hypothetical protein VIF09_07585, partial [Polyangiaceae bacterium]
IQYGSAPLFDDVTALQYAGWCLLHGVRLYDGVALPDGPFTFAFHTLLTLVAGTGAQAFRRLDLLIHALAGGAVGGLLVPSPAPRSRRALWAAVGAAAFVSLATSNDFWSSCQRESYWFALGALGLCLVHASIELRPATARRLLAAAGTLTGWLAFAKPTGALYATLALLMVGLLPRNPLLPRAAQLKTFGLGLVVAAASMVVFVAATGSLRGMYFWHVRYVLDVYRHFEPTPWIALLGRVRVLDDLTLSVIVLLAALGLTAAHVLPRHSVVFGAAPLLHLAAALAQGKGYAYQFLPVAASCHLFLLFALIRVFHGPPPARGGSMRGVLALAAFASCLLWTVHDATSSPWLDDSQLHLRDARIRDARDAGAYVRAHTGPGDPVVTWDSDARVALEALRRPALPELNKLMLDASAVIDAEGDRKPSPAARAAAGSFRRDVHADACHRLRTEQPLAMVFPLDEIPLDRMAGPCDGLAESFARDYELAATFGQLRVYLARDRPY